MKHRERVRLALEHQEPDRCPMQVSFTPEFAARLETGLCLDSFALHNPHGGGNTYELERRLDEDMLLTSVGWVNGYYKEGYQALESYRDEWGVTWKTMNKGLATTNVRSIAQSGTDPDVFYAGTNGSGLYRSRDGGESWEQMPSLTHNAAA